MEANWRPKLATGYFYVKDRGYHLYADKQTKMLEELKISEFTLTGYPRSLDSCSLLINGISYTDFNISGDILKVYHPDPIEYFTTNGTNDPDRRGMAFNGMTWKPDDDVSLAYEYLYSSAGTIMTGEATGEFTFRDASSKYKMPDPFYRPVIMTDDGITPTSAREFTPEFTIDPMGFLSINQEDNYVYNPAFEITPIMTGISSDPIFWTPSDASGVFSYITRYSYYGTKALVLPSGESVYQDINVPSGEQMRMSVWSRSPKASELELSFQYLTSLTGTPTGAETTATGEPSGDWTQTYQDFSGDYTAGRVKFTNNGPNPLFIDGVQVNEGSGLQFSHVPGAATVEYDADPSGLFIPGSGDYNIDDINLNPTIGHNTRGFVSLGQYIDDPHDEPLYKGGSQLYAPYSGEYMYYGGLAENDELAKFLTRIFRAPVSYSEMSGHYLYEG